MNTNHRILRRPALVLGFFAVLLLLFCHGAAGASSNNTTRIVGGRPTSISRMRYLVNLRINGVFTCGGTLVRRRYVVTAAHCVSGIRRRAITVVGGTSLLSRRGIRRKVSRVMIPRGFSMNTLNRDIAVLKLSRSMRGRNTRPIALCSGNWRVGQRVRVSGWGLTSESANLVPNRVRTARVRLISKQTCSRRYSSYAALTNSMFCASVPGVRDSCSGDSGGPLIYRGRLCGVVSWGFGCARRRFPGVYTSIKRMRDFIRKAMRR